MTCSEQQGCKYLDPKASLDFWSCLTLKHFAQNKSSVLHAPPREELQLCLVGACPQNEIRPPKLLLPVVHSAWQIMYLPLEYLICSPNRQSCIVSISFGLHTDSKANCCWKTCGNSQSLPITMREYFWYSFPKGHCDVVISLRLLLPWCSAGENQKRFFPRAQVTSSSTHPLIMLTQIVLKLHLCKQSFLLNITVALNKRHWYVARLLRLAFKFMWQQQVRIGLHIAAENAADNYNCIANSYNKSIWLPPTTSWWHNLNLITET